MKKLLPIVIIGVLFISGLGVGAISEHDKKLLLPSSFSDDYDMVIIAPGTFSLSLQPLIDHKNDRDP